MAVCYIIGAGDCKALDFKNKSEDLIIAADGGCVYLEKSGIKPDIIIGDFDSLGRVPEDNEVIKLSPEKDITDMHAAVDIGIERGYREFHLYGACGGRIDHTLANIQLIARLAKENFKAYIHDNKNIITALCNNVLRFDSTYKGYVSIFSHSDKCEGICLRGLKYPLENAVLHNTFSIGVSNEFLGIDSEISVKDGTAIIIYSLNEA